MKNPKKTLLFCAFLCLLLCRCGKESAHLTIRFTHYVDLSPWVQEAFYTNSSGNRYGISEVKYFISNLKLHTEEGKIIPVAVDGGIHYADADDRQSLLWNIPDLPSDAVCNGISFTFGLEAKDNLSHRFVNPPQSNMAWPQILGGGYHYMMLNGWFWQTDSVLAPLNVHLGRGQIYRTATDGSDSIAGYIDNDFSVRLEKHFRLPKGTTQQIEVRMHINRWFDGQSGVDFHTWGSHIMQNQTAMSQLRQNGAFVFTLH
jgi:hypothetical protein